MFKDKQITLMAVKENATALEYVDKTFRKDKEIVLEALKNPLLICSNYLNKTFK